MILREIDSEQYDTPWEIDSQGMIPWEVQKKFELLGEILTKIINILTHWSVAQTVLNEEKKGRQKSLWTVPFSCYHRNHSFKSTHS